MKAISLPRLAWMALATIVALPSCRDQARARAEAEWWRLEVDRIELAQQMKLQRLRQDRRMAEKAEWEAARSRVDDLSLRHDALRAERDALAAGVAKAVEERDEAKMAWIRSARDAAAGKSFDQLSGRGRLYREVVISRVTDAGVEFRHADGFARLTGADLSPAQQELFGLDAELAGVALERERAGATAYRHWVEGHLAAHEAGLKKKASDERRERPLREAASPPPSFASLDRSAQSSLREGPRSLGGESRGSASFSFYSYRRATSYPSFAHRYRAAGRPVIYDPDGSTYRYFNARPSAAGARMSGSNVWTPRAPRRASVFPGDTTTTTP